MLIDEYMNCIPIVETTKIELSCTYPKQYSEVIQRDRHNKITSIERRIVKVDIYSIEVEAPHTFLVSDRTYCKGKPRLLLTHNGIPALGAGLSLVFGSTPASLSFAQATASVGGLGVAFGPVGVAIGVMTGLGFLGYQFFKGQDKSQNSFYIERAGESSSERAPKNSKDPGGKKTPPPPPPSFDNKKKNENPAQSIVGTNFNKIKPTQSIVNRAKVDEYIKKLKAGEPVAPIDVYEVPGKGRFIAEGHHRFIASQETGIPVDIRNKPGGGPVGLSSWPDVDWKPYISEDHFWGS